MSLNEWGILSPIFFYNWVESPLSDAKDDDVLHIFSAIDLKKMIPVIDSVIREVNIIFV